MGFARAKNEIILDQTGVEPVSRCPQSAWLKPPAQGVANARLTSLSGTGQQWSGSLIDRKLFGERYELQQELRLG